MPTLIEQGLSWQQVSSHMLKHRDDTFAAVQPSIPSPPEDLPHNVTGIPKQLLSKDVIAITESSTEVLLAKLAKGELSSVQVTKAFLQRAGLASKLTNCVTELLPERSLARAKELDDYLAKHKKPIGPLHGLPISVKEHIAMRGLDLNAGFVAWVGKIAKEDALILKLLWQAGAVFHARTTEPQTLMHLETSNNIYGVTVNPYKTTLTSGGSSGGEGALIGMKGSCLGIGSDIGGSIRSPAANNGVFGFRPSTYRLPVSGWALTMAGEEHIIAVIGPLSTSLEGLKIFTKALIDQKPWLWEPSLLHMPWKEPSTQPSGTFLGKGSDGRRKLRIGILTDDGVVKPHPPILRGIKTLVSRLEKNPDIEIVEFPPYKHDEAWRIISSLYFADGAAEEIEAIEASGEPWRPMSKFIIKENPNVKKLSVPEVWNLTVQREEYRTTYNQHWNSVNTSLPGPASTPSDSVPVAPTLDNTDSFVDVILTPTGPGVAPPLDCARYWGYTAQWNLLDYPCVIFPTGLYVDGSSNGLDKVEEGYKPRNERDRWNYELYKPERFAEAPISLQVVGRRWEDEKLVEAVEVLLEAAGVEKVVGGEKGVGAKL
jgi:amidase